MEPQELAQALHSGTLNEAAVKLEGEREAALARGDVRARATAANDLGVVYYMSGQPTQAREAMESSRNDFAQLNDQAGEARALGNLARLEERNRNRRAALALYQQAADMFHEANDREDEFATLRSLSQLYLVMGGWLPALAAYDRGLMVKPHATFFDAILHWLYQIPLGMLGFNQA